MPADPPFFALAGPFDLAIVVVVIVFATFVLVRGQRSVHAKLGAVELTVNEVATAVNNVSPDEGKLIDQVREIKATQEAMVQAQNDLARIGHANHIAAISCETTIHAFGERLGAIGMKADSAAHRADAAHQLMTDYIEEQNIIESAVARGLLDRRKGPRE